MECPGLPEVHTSEHFPPQTGRSFADLIEQTDGNVRIACDTEFEGTHTLSIQFATRIGDDIVVQVYHSPAIPPLPSNFQIEQYVPEGLQPRFNHLIVRPVKEITPELSPVRVLADLFQLQNVLVF